MTLWVFLLAESLFNLGLFIFFLLFNLHLLDRGFDEAFVGLLTGLATAGSICGTLPAGWFTARFGVGPALRVTFAGGAAVCALQAWAGGRGTLLLLAALGGFAASFRAVTIAPAVAHLTTEANRPRAFSLFFGLAIAMGILGGLVGGRLPEWVGGMRAKQVSLWMGCGISALALAPAMFLRFGRAQRPETERVVYPRTPFVRRYLGAAAAWNLFVGAFPPFFNTYMLRRHGAAASQIGVAFSFSQLAQVAAMGAAPALFARTGLARGIPATQAAAALLVVLLAPSRGLASAALVNSLYMAAQWMSEPGWHSLLMNRVAPAERGGASALNFLVIFSAQAAAAAGFGAAVSRWGYPVALVSTALVGLLAAGLFRALLPDTLRGSPPASRGGTDPA